MLRHITLFYKMQRKVSELTPRVGSLEQASRVKRARKLSIPLIYLHRRAVGWDGSSTIDGNQTANIVNVKYREILDDLSKYQRSHIFCTFPLFLVIFIWQKIKLYLLWFYTWFYHIVIYYRVTVRKKIFYSKIFISKHSRSSGCHFFLFPNKFIRTFFYSS